MSTTMQKMGRTGGRVFTQLQGAKAKLISMSKKYGKVTKAQMLMVAAAVGMVARSIIRTTIKTAEMGDEAAKTSRRLGITAEELQKLRFAADRQGVSASLLDSSFMALQKRVCELRVETGGLYTYLSKKGEFALMNQLKGAKDTGEAFNILVTRMESIKDPMDRAAFANAAFSRAGLDMLKMMEAGGEGLAALKQQAVEYGAVMSNDAAAQSEKFVDTMTNFKAQMQGLKIMLATQLMPIIQNLVIRIQSWVKSHKQLLADKVKAFAEGVANAIGFLARNIEWIKPIIGVLIALLIGLKVAMIALNIAMMSGPIGWIIAAVAALVIGIAMLIKHWDKVKSAMMGVWEVVKSLGKMIKIYLLFPFKVMGQVLKDLGQIFLYVFTGQFGKAVDAGKTMINNLKESVKSQATEMAETAMGLGKDFQRGYDKGMMNAKEKSTASPFPDQQDGFEAGKKAASGFNHGFSINLKKQAMSNLMGGENLKRMMFLSKKQQRQRYLQEQKDQMAEADAMLGSDTTFGDAGMGEEEGTAISAGGSKQTNITINLANLVNEMNISGSDFEEATDDMKAKLVQGMLQVLNSANKVAFG